MVSQECRKDSRENSPLDHEQISWINRSTSEKSYLLNTKDIINVKEKDWTQEKNQKKKC